VPLSVALATTALNVPILVGAGLMIALGLVLAVLMPETGFRPTPPAARHTFGTLAGTLGEGIRVVRGSPLLITLLALAAFFGMASEGYDRLWTPHMLQDLVFPSAFGLEPVAWFGAIRIGGLVLAIAATEAMRRWLDTSNERVVAQALFAS